MIKKKNINAPGKGANVTVEPIRELKNIRAIIKLLNSQTRNKLLFLMGINNGLRACDLLRIKVSQVKSAKPGQSIPIKESKTGKSNILVINSAVHKVLKKYLEEFDLDDADYLFKSRQNKNQPLKTGTVNKLIKTWTSDINLSGRHGCATLRKTWGYIQRTNFGVGFEIIAKRYNHSSPRITMRYLCIQDKEVHETLMNEII